LVAPVSHFGQMRRDRVEAGKLEIWSWLNNRLENSYQVYQVVSHSVV
jgi:hypothetical protein